MLTWQIKLKLEILNKVSENQSLFSVPKKFVGVPMTQN